MKRRRAPLPAVLWDARTDPGAAVNRSTGLPEPQDPDRVAEIVVEAFAQMRVHSDKAARWCWRAAFSLSASSFAELAAQSAPWPWYPLPWAVAIWFGIDAVVGLLAIALITLAVFKTRGRPNPAPTKEDL